MNQMAVSRLEAGKRSLRFNEAIIIAETLGQPLPLLMDSSWANNADMIRQTALEAQAESSAEQIINDVVTTLRRQRELIEAASKIDWAMDEISYLMAGSLRPIDAIAREAVKRFFHGEFEVGTFDFLTEEQNDIQNEILSRYADGRLEGPQLDLLHEYLRRVNGVDQEEA